MDLDVVHWCALQSMGTGIAVVHSMDEWELQCTLPQYILYGVVCILLPGECGYGSKGKALKGVLLGQLWPPL